MSRPLPLRYPYNWGRGVVNSFVEKYARGTYFLSKLVDMSPGEVRHKLILTLCMDYSVRFEAVKRVIKMLEDYDVEYLNRYSANDKKLLYKSLLYIGEEDSLDAKTERKAIDNAQNHLLI